MPKQTISPREHSDQLELLRQKVAELEALIREKDQLIRKLTDEERVLEMLVKNMPNQVFWKSRDLIYMGCNQAFADVTGMKNPSQVIGKTDFDFHRDPAHAESYREWDRKIMDEGKVVLDIEEAYHNADGSEGWVLTSKVPLRNQEGEVFGILGICTDITDRKKMEFSHKRLINELEDALSEVKTLSGLIPICSHCKGIRDDRGYWKRIEVYITEHSNANFSHSICPDCMEKFYPDCNK